MISFIIPFSTIEKDKFLNLNEKEDLWEENDAGNIVYSTIKTIKNINSLKCEKEILLVDNSHTWPDVDLPNVRVIKGWQALPVEELEKIPEYMNHRDIQASLDNLLGQFGFKCKVLLFVTFNNSFNSFILEFISVVSVNLPCLCTRFLFFSWVNSWFAILSSVI